MDQTGKYNLQVNNSPSKMQKKEKIILFLGCFIVLLYLLPFIINYEHSYIIIHDNWDSNYIIIKILVESGKIFSSNEIIIENALNGLPRLSYPSSWRILVLLEYIFPVYLAYLINQIIIHYTAYFGMFFLLRKYFLEKSSVFISVGVATTFALLPFWAPGSLSVAGQPLALLCFLNVKNGESKWQDWLFIAIIPFFTIFALAFVFFLTFMFFFLLFDWLHTRKFNKNFLYAIILMVIIYISIEYRLIQSMFFSSNYQSQRTSFHNTDTSFIESIEKSLSIFIFGHYHAPSFQYISIGISSVVAFALILKNFYIQYKKHQSFFKLEKTESIIIYGLIIIGFFSFFYGFWSFSLINLIKSKITILREFNFTRFFFLFPTIWYIVFSQNILLIFHELNQKKEKLKLNKKINVFNKNIKEISTVIISTLILIQILFLFSQNIGYNHSVLDGSLHPPQRFDEFFAQSQFQRIHEEIGLDFEEYRVGCIGFHPSIAQFNGFYTIDGYFPNYPLEYKNKFQYLIQNELNKNIILQNYYNGGASRCYIMVDELGKDFMWTKERAGVINNLELNVTALYDLNCNYILSSVEIKNNNQNNLQFISLFSDNNSIWDIYLYRVI
ncbi:DUF6044 family protein [Candidatus Harpocratesius sp.]